jgi:tryptophan-rich sensory protein
MAKRHQSLIFFILLVVGLGWLMGAINRPGAWYASLAKPSFNPPGWVFGPTWTVLYVMIAVAGWRTYLREKTTALPMQLWFAQMALNFMWSPVVFTLHSLAFGLAIILTMLALIVSFIAVQWRDDKVAASLFVPYAAWVAFASILNFSLYRLN